MRRKADSSHTAYTTPNRSSAASQVRQPAEVHLEEHFGEQREVEDPGHDVSPLVGHQEVLFVVEQVAHQGGGQEGEVGGVDGAEGDAFGDGAGEDPRDKGGEGEPEQGDGEADEAEEPAEERDEFGDLCPVAPVEGGVEHLGDGSGDPEVGEVQKADIAHHGGGQADELGAELFEKDTPREEVEGQH